MPYVPSPIPRTRPITITHHGRAQAAARGFTEPQIKEAIVNGREIPQNQKGQKGGNISKFYMSFVERTGPAPITKSMVAVCEVMPDRYILLTTYKDKTKP